MYGFTARYVSHDGAQTNRTFLNINSGKTPSTMKCEIPSPYDPSLVFIMDSSHLKKVRNNILKRGTSKSSTRLLTLPDGSQIQWQMWFMPSIGKGTMPSNCTGSQQMKIFFHLPKRKCATNMQNMF